MKKCHLSQVFQVTCMNPVFLSVVPAASTRGEQGTQATAATVACQKILLIHLVVRLMEMVHQVHLVVSYMEMTRQIDLVVHQIHLVHLIILVDMVHQIQLVHQTVSCLDISLHTQRT